jgi:hypothetical protein
MWLLLLPLLLLLHETMPRFVFDFLNATTGDPIMAFSTAPTWLYKSVG